jgi:hypothetical protein
MKKLKANGVTCFILIFVLSFWGHLYGETFKYKITCLGIRAVDINITNYYNNTTGILHVNAESRFISAIFPYVHNIYITHYEDGFLPITYEKHIDQKKYFEDRIFTYNRETKTAVLQDRLQNKTIPYSIVPESRDFMSALLYIAQHAKDKNEVWLDANRLIWKAAYVIEDREILKTTLGKFPTIKLKIRFIKVSPEPKENTDMMTNQLVNEDNTLYLWVSDDTRHLPLKAKYERKPLPVYWEIVAYKP